MSFLSLFCIIFVCLLWYLADEGLFFLFNIVPFFFKPFFLLHVFLFTFLQLYHRSTHFTCIVSKSKNSSKSSYYQKFSKWNKKNEHNKQVCQHSAQNRTEHNMNEISKDQNPLCQISLAPKMRVKPTCCWGWPLVLHRCSVGSAGLSTSRYGIIFFRLKLAV